MTGFITGFGDAMSKSTPVKTQSASPVKQQSVGQEDKEKRSGDKKRKSEKELFSEPPKDAKELEFRKLYKSETVDIYKPAMFFDGFCWLRNGIKIAVKYKFKGGVYDGKTVEEINQKERYYKLDDGIFVHMY